MSKLIIKNNYGIIPNTILNRKDMSFKAKGLFGFLQSKPDKWKFSVARIVQQTKDEKDAINSGLKELEKLGYLRRIAVKNKEGRWEGYDYELAEKPFTENPSTEKPLTENPATLSKKDNSKKDIVIRNIDIAKQSFAGLNDLIDLFQHVNPSWQKLFANKTQRLALERLLKQHGWEKIEWIIKILPKTNKMQYSPIITTPYMLETKLGQLIAFIQKEQLSAKDKKIIKI